ncbi:hypothetical protein Droror1_Dr00022138 [Drosera rotundifolia]
MCGRARCTLRPDTVARASRLDGAASVRQVDVDRYRPSYNIAPGAYLPVLRREDGGDGAAADVVHCMKWGLVPSFCKKDEKPDHYRMFNARSESIREKASFRRLVPKNRCVVAVEGFYEWKKDGSKKQPYYIHFGDGQPLLFAALYDSWKNSEGEILYTFTIVTTAASSALQWLHDRMPVILGEQVSTSLWLNGSESSKVETVLKPYEGRNLVWYPVTPSMGKPSFNGPECIKEISLTSDEKPISKFFSKEVGKPKVPGTLVKGSDESKSDAEVTCKSSRIKAEPDVPAHIEVHEYSKVKRDFENFQAASGSDPRSTEISKPPETPAKKRATMKFSPGDKQLTLRSYFGKS